MPVTWETREEIESDFTPIKSISKPSTRDFSLPPTLGSDFDRLLQYDHPNHFSFELIPDWYDQSNVKIIRASQVPIDWKSKIGNSDMSTNFKVSKKNVIHKGDMVIREDGVVSLLTWNVIDHPNNYASQTTECNIRISVTREVQEAVDDDGFLITPAGKEVIVPDLPCVHSEYAGRPDYLTSSGLPGIHADHLITVQMQWNSHTKDIRINDEFELYCFTYRVINISVAEVNINQEYGILTLNAKRVAGGGIVEQ